MGSAARPISYQLPFDEKNKTIGTITLDNMKTRVVIEDIFKLVQVSIPTVEAQEEWKTCVGHYNDAIDILGQKNDLTDDEIMNFQWSVDPWRHCWIRINGGREGVTNYIHLLVSGHADYICMNGGIFTSTHSKVGRI
jgi:hypothetical protein